MDENKEREAFYEWEGQNSPTPLEAWLARASIAAPPAPSVADAAGASDLESMLADITAIDTWHRGSPSYEHDAGWFKDRVVRLIEERIAAPPVSSVADAAGASEFREVGVWETDGSKFKTYAAENLNGKAMFVRESK